MNLKVELGRKLVHFISIGILFIYVLVGQFSHRLALLALTLVLVLLIEGEFIRIESGKRFRFFRHLAKYRRPKEKDHFGGEVFFMIGAILCLAIFDFRIATAAILMTTFGDMSAALVGKTLGRCKLPKSKKTWEGTFAGLIMNLFIGFLFIRNTLDNGLWFLDGLQVYGTPIWPVIIVMALTASITEVLINKLDDNLLIPLFSGFNGQVVMLILAMQIIPI